MYVKRCPNGFEEYTLKELQCRLIQMIVLGSFSVIIAAPPPGPTGGHPEAGSSSKPAAVRLSGKVISKDGAYLLTDEKSQRTVELRGSNVKRFAGKVVTIQGQPVAGASLPPGATEVILVSKIAAGTGLAGGTATAAATHSGVSGVALGPIGVAAATAGTLGGLYASGTIGEDQPVSRP
jgi:hypothetical protein